MNFDFEPSQIEEIVHPSTNGGKVFLKELTDELGRLRSQPTSGIVRSGMSTAQNEELQRFLRRQYSSDKKIAMIKELRTIIPGLVRDMELNKDLVARVENKVLETYLCAQKLFRTNFELPQVTFDVTNRVAGLAYRQVNRLDFNPILLAENGDNFINRTVPHECAHAFAFVLYPMAKRYHGPEWKYIMRALGLEPSTCHSFSIENTTTRIHPRNYVYICACRKHFVTSNIHTKCSNGQVRRCIICKRTIAFLCVRDEV